MTTNEDSLMNMPGPWKLCTVTQVEETKILIRMLPIIISTFFMNTCLAQLQTFSIQQATTMDTTLLGSFHVPGPSLPVIPLVLMAMLVPIYDRIFVPIARRFTGIPTGIRPLQRVGVGLVLSALSMAIAGIMETRRKSVAIEHNMVDSTSPLPMSVFWLGFQYAIFGAADLFTLVGLLEFFYAESSVGMKSLSTAISWSSVAFGYFLSTVVVEVVNKVSGGWLASNNLNRDKLNYFYWLLAGMSALNFGFYLVCASWYKYKKVEMDGEAEKLEMVRQVKGWFKTLGTPRKETEKSRAQEREGGRVSVNDKSNGRVSIGEHSIEPKSKRSFFENDEEEEEEQEEEEVVEVIS
ncbi:hypothetical protein Scep_000477 [Stephania cephalantha]|uniref:Uncharacterized protein n=1 Tax=Stephania cephalantha TaxID=152367 RepID=A0AAP0L6S0_9MAGN